MDWMIAALIVFGLSFAVFALTFVALLRVNGTCVGQCDTGDAGDAGDERLCHFCHQQEPDGVLDGASR